MDIIAATPLEPVAEPPLQLSRSYVGYLCSEDQEDFIAAKLYIKQVLPRELDVQHSWKKQSRGTTDRLLLKILDIFPAFKKYSKAWPVQYYSYQRFAQIRARLRLEGRLSKRCFLRSVADSEAARSDPTRTQPPRERNTQRPSSTVISTNSFLAGGPGTSQGADPGSSTQTRGIPHLVLPASNTARASEDPTLVGCSGAVPQRPVEKTNETAATSQAANGEQELLEFLTSMDKSFAYLQERFRLAGLTSKARLQIMARWPPAEIDEFLHGTLRLSAFERKVGMLPHVEAPTLSPSCRRCIPV
ncbi:hypothetical protein FKP32DRAFT_712775 [Trametes sanguinea]|nr:hypothetical protein FKP32DRAFT_712775 [Trametes sanguinea]